MARRVVDAARERGQSLVEFALVLPVFFVLSVTLIDVGRAFVDYNTASNSAREAARFASVWGGSVNVADPILGLNWTTPYGGSAPGTYSASSGHPVSGYVDTHTIVGTVARYATGISLDDLTVTISTRQGAITGNPVQVSLDYSFRPASTLLFGGGPISVRASSEMTIE